jgi:hypothetical protein
LSDVVVYQSGSQKHRDGVEERDLPFAFRNPSFVRGLVTGDSYCFRGDVVYDGSQRLVFSVKKILPLKVSESDTVTGIFSVGANGLTLKEVVVYPADSQRHRDGFEERDLPFSFTNPSFVRNLVPGMRYIIRGELVDDHSMRLVFRAQKIVPVNAGNCADIL